MRLARDNIRQARPYKSVTRQVLELFEHKLRINTSFADYYRFGFFDSELSWDEKALYLGPNGSRYWPFEGNSLKFDRLFAVKSLQKILLAGAGLPSSKMLLRAGARYSLDSLPGFEKAFNDIEVPVVCKFDGGGGGSDVYVLDRREDGFYFGETAVDATWVWQRYADRIERGFLVEERLSNHPRLEAVYPDAVNSLRIAIVQTGDGRWHCVNPFLKIGRGGARIDNMSAGGLFAGIDRHGVVGKAYARYEDSEYTHHPDTGAAIEGMRIPYFEEALDLAAHASRTLAMMQTYGWDVAITPDGPMLIEANPGWHFKAVQQRLGPYLTPEIAAGLRPRAWYTPWDRTHMYPGYLQKYHGGPWQRLLAARRRYWRRRLAAVDTSG